MLVDDPSPPLPSLLFGLGEFLNRLVLISRQTVLMNCGVSIEFTSDGTVNDVILCIVVFMAVKTFLDKFSERNFSR